MSKKNVEILESEKKYRHLFESAPFSIMLMDLKTKILEYNVATCILLGYSKEELIGKSRIEISANHSQIIPFLRNRLRKLLKGEPIGAFEHQLIRKDNEKVWVSALSSLVQIKNRTLIQIISQDITEKRSLERELEQSEELYRLISENANDLILIFNDNFKVEYVNEGALFTILGYHLNEFIGKMGPKFLHPDDLEVVLELFKHRLELGEGKIEVRIRHKEGKYIWVEALGKMLTGKNNKTRALIISRDISEKKQAELLLKESEEKFREAFYLVKFYKDLFAHDMNNILQSIVSSAELYSLFRNESEPSEKFGDMAEVVKKHAMRGATLISMVMKLSNLDESEIKLKKIKILNILEQSVDHAISGFKGRNVKIEVNGLSKDMQVLGNELLIEIFDNILNNAVKYNDNEKEVKVDINVSKIQEDGTNYMKLEFKDRGMGVSDEIKGCLFEREYTRDISEKGMGIGLSLVKKLTDRYEGKIWVEDRVRDDYTKGSNFILLLIEA